MSTDLSVHGDLAIQINEKHRLAMEHYGKTIEHAIACGEMLIEAKAKVPHGQWLPWLRANVTFSERSVQGYMRLAKNPRRVADLSIRDGLQRLSTPRRDMIGQCDAEIAVWLEQSRELKANRPAPEQWSREDAIACADNIRSLDKIMHRHGICAGEHDCLICADEA